MGFWGAYMGKRNYKVGTSVKKSFIRVIILLIIGFGLIGFYSSRLISYLFYEEIKGESITMAENYANELSNSNIALETIHSLIDVRMELTVKLVINDSQEASVNDLASIADEYNVREINIYDKDRKIQKSNIYRYIGWEITPDHPAYEYFHEDSNQEIFIEDIRKDALSEVYMKYTYMKNDKGNVIQVGFQADTYYDLIEHFQVHRTIEELNKFNNIMGAQFIDNSINISSQKSSIENYEFIIDQAKTDAINQDAEYSNKTICCGEDVFEVMIPVYRDDEKLGTLAISYLISDLMGKLKLIYFTSIASLILIFAILARGIFNIIKRNKRFIELVYYDQLTGLPNTDYLIEYFEDSISKRDAEDISKNKAILLIDIVNFNLIFLTHGYMQGEIVIKQISEQINGLLKENEELFKIGESQFIIYIGQYKSKESLRKTASKVSSLFKPNTKKFDIPSHVTVKIGINEIEESSEDILEIITNAQIAANRHINNKCNCEFFDNEMSKEITRKNYIEDEIKKIIKGDKDNIYLDYQPQLDLRSNTISGFEGLARMKTDKFGQVSPLEFISIAVESNLIVDLGLILMEKACMFLSELHKEGFDNVIVAVNISTIQILRDDFSDNVMKIIEKLNINPNCLELEITESEFIDNFDIVNVNLMKLKGIGISVAIDDFGTGYSSLTRLRELNIDRVKIDKSFIDTITTSKKEETIISDIISLAHKMNLETVAEGVELEEEKDYLIDSDCDIMQGYLFSKPVSWEMALDMLKETDSK